MNYESSKLEHLNLLNKKCFFIIPEPVEAQVHIVPHMKALMHIKSGFLRAKAWWHFWCLSESPLFLNNF